MISLMMLCTEISDDVEAIGSALRGSWHTNSLACPFSLNRDYNKTCFAFNRMKRSLFTLLPLYHFFSSHPTLYAHHSLPTRQAKV